MSKTPAFFATEADFRRWLAANHAGADELLVGFWKKGSGKPSIDWPQARDQALCFGWIDGVRKSLDADSYMIRFTPRRPGSIWSKVNVERFEALKAAGRMTEAGARAFAGGRENRSHYSYESEPSALSPEETGLFRKNAAAWADWEKRPPGYRRMALHWVTSAKRPETRARRLATLIEDSEAGRKLGAIDISRKKPG
ncbi:YdeI family protein [Sphingosinicella sp. CPCC 101087]|uniref:YdeI/OmpD-associated family protein n=1 Tax=Sphingosinicella sp. CPCC 101087 TaxID=2497754 RepID=UPI00101D195F|nr:YdeI/OmpD-associated family protein [Sphingosinicella sp. CPCC 101087]